MKVVLVCGGVWLAQVILSVAVAMGIAVATSSWGASRAGNAMYTVMALEAVIAVGAIVGGWFAISAQTKGAPLWVGFILTAIAILGTAAMLIPGNFLLFNR